MTHKFHILTRTIFAMLVLALSAGIDLVKVNAEPTPSKPDRRPNNALLPEMSMLRSLNAGAREGDSSESATADPWFFLVFQQAVNNNWELYLQTGYYGPFTRLTTNNMNDISPSLNYSATQIVWASALPGNYDLYTMNVDGSNAKRILATPYNENSPSWSQNGEWIVFDAEINERYDIFKVKPDGSGLTNLTQTPAIDEYYPNWSPDNQEIVFVRNSDSGAKIYVMDADGTNLRPITGNLNYLGKPMWSPDGAWIGFDADLDGDGWNELGQVRPDGTNLVKFFDYGTSYYDAWMSGWWNNSQSVVMTRVQYRLYNGSLYVYRVDAGRVSLGGSAYTYFQNNGVAAFPYYQINDHVPPTLTLHPLDPYLHAEKWPLLCYYPYDPGTASYELATLQHRSLPNGEWKNFFVGSSSTNCINITGTPGVTYEYRGKGADAAGNIGLWSSEEPQTTFYAPEVDGQVLDNRNLPVAGVDITLSPPAINPVKTGLLAHYSAYLPGDGLYTFTPSPATIPGYTHIISEAINYNFDAPLNLPLKPLHNLLRNSNFEMNSGSFTEWITHTGSLTVETTTTNLHSGSFSAALGLNCATDPCLDKPVNSPFPFASSFLFIDAHDTMHHVEGGFELKYTSKPAGGSWSALETIPLPEANYERLGADLAIAPDGTIYASGSYYSYGKEIIYLAQRSPGQSWQTAIRRDGHELIMSVDSNNILHILYSYGNQCYYQQCTAYNNCQTPQLMYTSSINDHDMVIGPDDRVHVVIANGNTLFYKIRQTDGTWTDENIPQVGRRIPQIVASPDGSLTVFGRMLGNSKTASLPPGGSWSEITNHPEFDDNGLIYADPLNRIHLVGGTDNTNKSYYKNFHPGFGWSAAEKISDRYNAEFAMAGDSTGRIYILDSFDGTMRTNLPMAENDNVFIEQTVTVPITMHMPTLNFNSQLTGAIPWGNSGFSIIVLPQSGEPVEVFSDTNKSTWAAHWVDLTNWSGETITVRFNLKQAAGDPYLRLSLDDISLGSWLTPQIISFAPITIPSGSPFVLQIQGLNFIQTPSVRIDQIPATSVTWISSDLIEATFDEPIPAGMRELWVANPQGPSTGKAIVIGKLLYLPIVNR